MEVVGVGVQMEIGVRVGDDVAVGSVVPSGAQVHRRRAEIEAIRHNRFLFIAFSPVW
jgi:hypothetical protein